MVPTCLLFSFATVAFAAAQNQVTDEYDDYGSCPPDAFACAEGRCIPNEWVCDGFVDCVETGQGIDEDVMMCEKRAKTDVFKLPEFEANDGLFLKFTEENPMKRVQIQPISPKRFADPEDVQVTSTILPPSPPPTTNSVCPSELVLHKVCSKTLNIALGSVGSDLVIERRDQPFPRFFAPHTAIAGPLTIQSMIRGCLSYATYKGCVVALAPTKECLPKHRVSDWLTTTYKLFCNADTLSNVTQHYQCFHKVRTEPNVLSCQQKFLVGNLLPKEGFEVCPTLLNFYRFSQCVQEKVRVKCDRSASSFFEEIQQNIMNELANSRCHPAAINLVKLSADPTTTQPPKTKGFTIRNSESTAPKFTTSNQRRELFGTDMLPFMMDEKMLAHKLKPKLKLSQSPDVPRPPHIVPRKAKRLFPACSAQQESRGRECFRWVSALPHSGTNLPPNEWLLLMASRNSPLMDDTCHALKIYQRCLEETVYRADGRCAFESWIPTHVEIAQGVLCDEEVLRTMRANLVCLEQANATEPMDDCAAMDLDIVKYLRAVYDPPRQDMTCQVLGKLKATYECIGDAAFPFCGREILFGLGKVKMNLMRLSIEEGCSGCS